MAAVPAPTESIPERIVVIGCAGSGKTTLAQALAVRLGARHIERDALGDDESPGFATRSQPRWINQSRTERVRTRRCTTQRG